MNNINGKFFIEVLDTLFTIKELFSILIALGLGLILRMGFLPVSDLNLGKAVRIPKTTG